MGKVSVSEGRIEVEWSDGPGLVLPESINDELLAAIFDAEPGDEGHIATLCGAMDATERERLAVACALNPAFTNAFSRAALDWAAVGADGDWKNIPLDIVWSDKVGTSLIDTLFVTREGVWFVGTPLQGRVATLYTDAEFTAAYGNDIRKHLTRYILATQDKVKRVIEIMDSEIVHRKVTLERDGAIVSENRCGPAAAKTSQWCFKPNETFLDEG